MTLDNFEQFFYGSINSKVLKDPSQVDKYWQSCDRENVTVKELIQYNSNSEIVWTQTITESECVDDLHFVAFWPIYIAILIVLFYFYKFFQWILKRLY